MAFKLLFKVAYIRALYPSYVYIYVSLFNNNLNTSIEFLFYAEIINAVYPF